MTSEILASNRMRQPFAKMVNERLHNNRVKKRFKENTRLRDNSEMMWLSRSRRKERDATSGLLATYILLRRLGTY